jgi:hypothetical protein
VRSGSDLVTLESVILVASYTCIRFLLLLLLNTAGAAFRVLTDLATGLPCPIWAIIARTAEPHSFAVYRFNGVVSLRCSIIVFANVGMLSIGRVRQS